MSFTDTLVSDPGTISNPQKDKAVVALEKKIRAAIRKNGGVGGVEGIYGDGLGCGAYVEREELTEDGWLTWFYGCSYPYKGRIRADFTDASATMKRVLMEGIRLVAKFPFLLLFRKTLIKSFLSIYRADFEKYQYIEDDPAKSMYQFRDFSGGKREILRVLLRLAKNEDERRLAYCLVMFLEADNAYWQRLQDALSAILKERAVFRGAKFRDILDVLLERDCEETVNKFKLLRRFVVGLSIFPSFRKFEAQFFEGLDDFLEHSLFKSSDKVRRDEADWYFTLNRRGYNFGGISYRERYEEFERVNQEKGHVILGI